jgi:hypothetical protein
MPSSDNGEPHWLDQYAQDYHSWHDGTDDDGRRCVYRRQGCVEASFDVDGMWFEGRADINASLELEIVSQLTIEQLERRILLAWTALRLHHVLLMTKAVDPHSSFKQVDKARQNRFFLLHPPTTPSEAREDAASQLVFARKSHASIDIDDFYRHAQNVARVIEPTRALGKLFVMPLEKLSPTRARLNLLLIMSHSISDGLTNYTWMRDFLALLNKPILELEQEIAKSLSESVLRARLPVPQEDLYPRITGGKARERWYWAIMRVLRYTRKALPTCFPNPLRHASRSERAVPLPQRYPDLLDYSKLPPLNTYTVQAKVPVHAAQKLVRLCKEAKASVGAGCFVLVGMVQMSVYEHTQPSIALKDRLPFTGSFPLDPRSFYNHHSEPNSMQLAFSDGVVLPFLPSSLDFAKRFRILVRQAQRQLSVYQKGKRTKLGAAGQILAHNYLYAIERTGTKIPEHARSTVRSFKPQGKYEITVHPGMATCGVSSVGRTAWREGLFDLDKAEKDLAQRGEDGFAADFRSSRQNVRARDGEFLVGVWGNTDGTIAANVSFDGNAIDESMAHEWKRRMERCLDEVSEVAKL